MATDEYLNFDLAIEPHAGGYQASVRASPGGDATQPFELPFTAEGLENLVLKLGRSRTVVRRVASGHGKLAERFGQQLYETVMASTVGLAYHTSLQEAERQGKGLRLRLNLDGCPELADVPWELLYSPTLHRPLVLSSRTPIVRYVGLPFAAKPLTVQAPLKVLVVVAAPTDLVELDTDAEVARIVDATEDLTTAGLIQIDVLPQATLTDLVRRLERGDCHVLHFIGHGGYEERGRSGEGVLAFENEDRLHQLVPGDKLGLLLHDHVPLRLAVLNACEGARTSPTEPFSGVAQSLVRQGVPAVIAMQFEVTDTAATVFGHELYRALADGCTIDRATAIARKAMFAGNHDVEWATPVLYLRATGGRLFDVRSEVGVRPDPIDAELIGWYAGAKQALATWASTRSLDSADEAVALLEKVLARRPDFRDADGLLSRVRSELADHWYRLAGDAITAGEHREADAALDRVDDLDPHHGDPEELREQSQPVAPPPPMPTPSPPPQVSPSDSAGVERTSHVEDGTSPTEVIPPTVPARLGGDDAARRSGDGPSPPEPQPDPEMEGRRRRWVAPALATVGLLAGAATLVAILTGNDTTVDSTPDTDVVASYLPSPTIGGENPWAAGLDRSPTPHPAEGEDDDPEVSSEWAFAWDERALYLSVTVTDPAVETPYADEPHLLYRGDGVNLLFGSSPDGSTGQAPLRDDDIQITIGPSDRAAETAVAGVQFATGDGTSCRDGRVFARGRAAPEITATSRPSRDGYELAAAVPWSLLGHEPDASTAYGLLFSVADVDASREPPRQRGSRSSHPDRLDAKHCPGQWQTLALLPG